jgi:hypothetical protein
VKKVVLSTVAAALISASPFVSLEANAGPNFQPLSPALQPINKGPIYSPGNPALQPIGKLNGPIINPAKNPCVNGGWCDPNKGGGGWNHGGLGIRVGIVSAVAAVPNDEDCYYVRRRVFVPGVGFMRKRALICE